MLRRVAPHPPDLRRGRGRANAPPHIPFRPFLRGRFRAPALVRPLYILCLRLCFSAGRAADEGSGCNAIAIGWITANAIRNGCSTRAEEASLTRIAIAGGRGGHVADPGPVSVLHRADAGQHQGGQVQDDQQEEGPAGAPS